MLTDRQIARATKRSVQTIVRVSARSAEADAA